MAGLQVGFIPIEGGHYYRDALEEVVRAEDLGFDNGDPTWRWFYGQRDSTTEISKDLTVRFSADGIVKSYAFSSSFPDDLRRLDDPRRPK